MRLAVLDIGSNTAHVVVAEGNGDGTFSTVAQDRAVLKLAEAAFPAMEVPEDAAVRLIEIVDEMRRFADEHRSDALVAFATSAIREAKNGMAILGRVRQQTGVPIKVLPGTEEARLTYLAARSWAAFSARRLLVLDIGGGSFEISGGERDRPEIAESLPLGATRLSRRFLTSDPPEESELTALRVHCLSLLGPVAARVQSSSWDTVCATSKTFRTLARVAENLETTASPSERFGFAGIDGRTAAVLTSETVNLLAGYLARTTSRQRSRLKGVDRLRESNLVAGTQLAALAMQAFGLDHLVLAPWALREGVILETLRGESGLAAGPEGAPGPRHAALLAFARRYEQDQTHAQTVVDLALSLFDQTVELHGCGAPERELLYFAALLHDVGVAVAQSAHHKHSLYIIENAEIEGFTSRELKLIANIARYHRKALPADHHGEYMALSPDDRQLVRRLGALLRLADGMDLDHLQVVRGVEVARNGKRVTLTMDAKDEPHLALWAIGELSDLFELEYGLEVRTAAPVVT
ncbi:MAG: Ppx/GppA family phosphatase [Candidatus Dormibacteraeota bacterium]|nr:Ppx/GppA family phosphatase [Candidatus Dormibacteraeota bacterium]